MLITCKKDGAPLALIAWPEGEISVACPICGSGGDSKQVIVDSAGLKAGFISKEQVEDLRKQMRLSGKEGL